MSIKERIGWKFLSWRKGEHAGGRITLPGAARHARKVCVLLPSNFDDFDIVRVILPEIFSRLENAQLTIWVRDNYRSWLIINESCSIMSYDPVQCTKLGLPDNAILKQIRSTEYDLLLDLSLNPELYVAALAKEVRAEMKVALAHPQTEEFYNLLVESDSEDRGRKLLALLNYL
ncbi:hypothetical protein HUU59_01050 [bacterium]|nr:hypothetical protein [bacterium]